MTSEFVGTPLKLSDSPAEIERSPLLGDRRDLLSAGELGFHSEELPLLKGKRVI
ncbi:hypothetical protein E0500_017400 [Streptomyces sp. KM273126]|uniref:hypothetical protein n=1 Tax=Streptomyces sp. KM273126 TaxID=2545247 RepID=UPI0014052119|nr:hypothetical protein [Streptomyces sp. KM273126]MBA2809123.1 hypothetical protein [Streptomyces sp. KM273126]